MNLDYKKKKRNKQFLPLVDDTASFCMILLHFISYTSSTVMRCVEVHAYLSHSWWCEQSDFCESINRSLFLIMSQYYIPMDFAIKKSYIILDFLSFFFFIIKRFMFLDLSPMQELRVIHAFILTVLSYTNALTVFCR